MEQRRPHGPGSLEPGELAFYWHRGFVLIQAILGPLFTVICGDALLFHRWLDGSTISNFGKALLGISLLGGIAVTVAATRGLLDPKPVLYTDRTGLWSNPPEANRGPFRIPWVAMQKFELRVDKVGRERPKHWITLQLDPDAWKAPDWLFDPTRAEVQLDLLNVPAEKAFHTLRMRWRRARFD